MDPLAQQLRAFLQAPPAEAAEADFNTLALALFARQYALNAPFRRLCDSEGRTPGVVTRWRDIPAVPAQAFKVFDLSCVPLMETVAVFHSSGTTGAQTSRHFMDADALALYDVGLRIGFRRARPDAPERFWAMMPNPEAAPHSSLSHMLGSLGATRFYWDNDAALATALAERTDPLILFGTAFAFVQLFDSTDRVWKLPTGSVVVETGGFKGRTREVPREELYDLFQTRLGVPETHCVSEYGMSEMASQFYGTGLDPIKRGPHWVRNLAIDPQTGENAAPGMPGLLRHYDLANFNSVLALQTQDRGTLTPDGFVLHGRAPAAEVRGCSLTVEELWASR